MAATVQVLLSRAQSAAAEAGLPRKVVDRKASAGKRDTPPAMSVNIEGTHNHGPPPPSSDDSRTQLEALPAKPLRGAQGHRSPPVEASVLNACRARDQRPLMACVRPRIAEACSSLADDPLADLGGALISTSPAVNSSNSLGQSVVGWNSTFQSARRRAAQTARG